MKNYLIIYDLNFPGHDYSDFYSALAKFPYIRALETVCFIKSDLSAKEITQFLTGYTDMNYDKLIITEITMNHDGWLDKEKWGFLK